MKTFLGRGLGRHGKGMFLAVALAAAAGCTQTYWVDGDILDAAGMAAYRQQVLTGVDPTQAVDPLALPPSVKNYVDLHVDRSWPHRRRLDALQDMLFDEEALDLVYDSQETLTAAETFAARRGNCLSMTNLFIAAARYMGIDAQYQVVSVKPTWEQSGIIMIHNEHINATGNLPLGTGYVIDFLPEIIYDDPDAYVVSDDTARALYYNNLGAIDVIRGEYGAAIEDLKMALVLDPELSVGWNNIGTALKRTGELTAAEFAYNEAIRLDRGNYTAMSNLSRLYRNKGDMRRASVFSGRVKRFRARNPYFLFFESRRAYEAEDYLRASKLLKRAIRLKKDEPRFYQALGQTYGEMGRFADRADMLAKAETFESRGPGGARKMKLLYR